MNHQAISLIVGLAPIAVIAVIVLYMAKKAKARKIQEAAAWNKCANCSHFRFEHYQTPDTTVTCQECDCHVFEVKQTSDIES